jgi:hypothetical protein
MVSGDPFVVIEVDRDPTGEDDADADEESDFRPMTALRVDVVDRVGEVSAVPIDTRGGRDSLLPPPVSPLNVDGRPIGVGVEYIIRFTLMNFLFQ